MCVGGRRGLCGSVIQEWRGWAVLVLARPAHLSARQLALADQDGHGLGWNGWGS